MDKIMRAPRVAGKTNALLNRENEIFRSRISQLEQENATLIAMQAWYEGEVERLQAVAEAARKLQTSCEHYYEGWPPNSKSCVGCGIADPDNFAVCQALAALDQQESKNTQGVE